MQACLAHRPTHRQVCRRRLRRGRLRTSRRRRRPLLDRAATRRQPRTARWNADVPCFDFVGRNRAAEVQSLGSVAVPSTGWCTLRAVLQLQANHRGLCVNIFHAPVGVDRPSLNHRVAVAIRGRIQRVPCGSATPARCLSRRWRGFAALLARRSSSRAGGNECSDFDKTGACSIASRHVAPPSEDTSTLATRPAPDHARPDSSYSPGPCMVMPPDGCVITDFTPSSTGELTRFAVRIRSVYFDVSSFVCVGPSVSFSRCSHFTFMLPSPPGQHQSQRIALVP